MSRELKTGIVVLLIIICSLWGFNFLKGQNLFDGGTRVFKVEYPKIGGLAKSSPVTINGLKVGTVDKIEFDTNEATRGHLIVTFSVQNDFEFSKESVVQIYSPNPLSGSNLAIVPSYKGETAVSGDTLMGEMEESLFTSIGERLDPLQAKLEKVIVSADTLFTSVNKILNEKAVNEIDESIADLSLTIKQLKNAIISVNGIVDENKQNLKIAVDNTKNITENFEKISDSIATVNFKNIVNKAENAVDNFNQLSQKINSNNGTVGKLINDDKMYDNLEAASKELEELLKDLKLNPKRYVHFSIFGKKGKPFKEEAEVKN
ncbi:MlaD family protein [uncultured Polaribacter sp.]|uniref:MlaD family protein n=1 Tax=uncultured Polaribacter sp. TaxID=174711 RepID=UPI002613B75A|nr:MlaD family protein [uncultured Polaribacter sp.]